MFGRTAISALRLCLLVVVLTACRGEQPSAVRATTPPAEGSPSAQEAPPSTVAMSPSAVRVPSSPVPASPSAVQASTPASLPPAGLFFETDAVGKLASAPFIIRSRFVKVNLDLLLDEQGQPRQVKEITVNPFPDVIYTGVIEQVEPEGDGYSWVGYLKGIAFSRLTMVYTGGVFIAHYASPGGVYEVSTAGADLYQVIQIDQRKLPQEK